MNKQKLKGLWIPADRVSKIISSLRDKNYIKVKLKYKYKYFLKKVYCLAF